MPNGNNGHRNGGPPNNGKGPPKSAEKQTKNKRQQSPAERIAPYMWKPGQSGNPHGRPPAPLSWRTMLRNRLDGPVPQMFHRRAAQIIYNVQLTTDQPIPKDIQAKIDGLTYLDFVSSYMLAQLGMRSDQAVVRDILELLSHLEGRPTFRVAGPEGEPLQGQGLKLNLQNLSEDDLRKLKEIYLKANENKEIEIEPEKGDQ